MMEVTVSTTVSVAGQSTTKTATVAFGDVFDAEISYANVIREMLKALDK